MSSVDEDVTNAAQEGNDRARLALDMFCYSVRKYIGAYAAAMNGVDMIIFTGGIGENHVLARKMITTQLGYLGVEFNEAVNNETRGADALISAENSKVKVAVVTTDEELVIARDTMRLTTK